MSKTPAVNFPDFMRKKRPRHVEGQALAEMLHLPRICLRRRCRRSKQCLGADLRCLLDHSQIAVERWRAHERGRQENELRRRVAQKEGTDSPELIAVGITPVPAPPRSAHAR